MVKKHWHYLLSGHLHKLPWHPAGCRYKFTSHISRAQLLPDWRAAAVCPLPVQGNKTGLKATKSSMFHQESREQDTEGVYPVECQIGKMWTEPACPFNYPDNPLFLLLGLCSHNSQRRLCPPHSWQKSVGFLLPAAPVSLSLDSPCPCRALLPPGTCAFARGALETSCPWSGGG